MFEVSFPFRWMTRLIGSTHIWRVYLVPSVGLTFRNFWKAIPLILVLGMPFFNGA